MSNLIFDSITTVFDPDNLYNKNKINTTKNDTKLSIVFEEESINKLTRNGKEKISLK